MREIPSAGLASFGILRGTFLSLAEGGCDHKHAAEYLKSIVRYNTINVMKVNISLIDWINKIMYLASNTMKLERRGNNPNKKILMYISYVLYGFRLNIHNTC